MGQHYWNDVESLTFWKNHSLEEIFEAKFKTFDRKTYIKVVCIAVPKLTLFASENNINITGYQPLLQERKFLMQLQQTTCISLLIKDMIWSLKS